MRGYGRITTALLVAWMLTTVHAMEVEVPPDTGAWTEQAPEQFSVLLETSRGHIRIDVHRDWAPRGADRFYNLVRSGFFDDTRFFRVVPNFVVQFGLSGEPRVNVAWSEARIKDDPVKGSNRKGTLSFATAGPNTRTTQVFINLRDNIRLDEQGFSPFAEVSDGMDVVAKLYGGYGDGMNEAMIRREGNPWLDKNYPELDRLIRATILPEDASTAQEGETR